MSKALRQASRRPAPSSKAVYSQGKANDMMLKVL